MSSYLPSYRYQDLLDFIRSGRSKVERKIENNTCARLGDKEIIVKLWNTDICQVLEDNTIILNSGGYKTPTTKDRFNKILDHIPYKVYQELGLWYLWNYKTNDKYPFADGLTINPDMSVSCYGKDEKYLLKLRSKIKRYAKQYVAALISGKVDKPNNGDCLYCQMREVNTNIPIGEFNRDNDHLLLHFRESYYVGSLLYRAIELYPVSQFAMWELQELWFNEKTDDPMRRFKPDNMLSDQAYKSLVKYLYSQFNLPY